MKKLTKVFHTVRYLKVRQVFYRLYSRFRKPCAYAGPIPSPRGILGHWDAPAFISPATNDGKVFTFLGVTAHLKSDWNCPGFTKLWLYNLHYQDDLNALGVDQRSELCRRLVDSWIEGNPALQGNGWEPYCLSLRIVNWVKWLSRIASEDIKLEWLASLASQVDALDQQLEHHILANHLFANAKALVFAGVFFGGKRGDLWLQTGLKLLDREVPEQFLSDGAHYELSPMYHAILLWDLADLVCLQQSTHLAELDQRAVTWKQHFNAGFHWLKYMVHPDQDLSFFNDTTLGISPTFRDLSKYAKHLTFEFTELPLAKGIQGYLFESSGYAVVDWHVRHRLIADVARVGPDYQPGHAHADTLSCELSLFGQRVFVNSGISQYGDDAERHRQRATAAHNTVEVDYKNSSEVWAGFRVARRAKPFAIDFQTTQDKVSLKASHDGYHRLAGKVTHTRLWLAEATRLTINDQIAGRYQHAVAYWHLHPDIQLGSIHSSSLVLLLPEGQKVKLYIEGAELEVHDSTWHPGFGLSLNNKKLVLKLCGSKLITQLEWSLD